MAISDFFFGTPEKTEQVPTIDGGQQQFLDQIMQLLSQLGPDVQSYFADLFSQDPEAFERFAAPARREFEEKTIPALAEQFAGSGALSSSGFQQALGEAGAGLSEKLAQFREGLKTQGIQSLQNLGQVGLSVKPFGYQTTGAQPGLLQNLASGIGSGVGKAAGAWAGSKFL